MSQSIYCHLRQDLSVRGRRHGRNSRHGGIGAWESEREERERGQEEGPPLLGVPQAGGQPCLPASPMPCSCLFLPLPPAAWLKNGVGRLGISLLPPHPTLPKRMPCSASILPPPSPCSISCEMCLGTAVPREIGYRLRIHVDDVHATMLDDDIRDEMRQRQRG